MGHITDNRASSKDGLLENHDYVDLRGMTVEDVQDALSFETEVFRELEDSQYSDESIERVDDEWLEAGLLPVDFGMGSAVAALSAVGCVPITSCRGASLDDGHPYMAPTVTFFAETRLVSILLAAAKDAGVSIENNTDMLEVFCADLRAMNEFARSLVGTLPSS
jgi:hypothetical protein